MIGLTRAGSALPAPIFKALIVDSYILILRKLKEPEVMDQLVREASIYFDSFVQAFATFEGEKVAELFAFPYLSVDQNGNRRVLSQLAETAKYFQEYLDSYKSGGSDSCSYHSLEVTPIGQRAALAAVTWSLRNAAGDELSTWRESYCVLRNNGQMLAYASIDHAK